MAKPKIPPVDPATFRPQAEALAAQLEAEGHGSYYLGSAPASPHYSLLLKFLDGWDHSLWGPIATANPLSETDYKAMGRKLSLVDALIECLQAGHGTPWLSVEMQSTEVLRDNRRAYEGSLYWIDSGIRDAQDDEKRKSLEADKAKVLRAIAEVDAVLAQRGLKG